MAREIEKVGDNSVKISEAFSRSVSVPGADGKPMAVPGAKDVGAREYTLTKMQLLQQVEAVAQAKAKLLADYNAKVAELDVLAADFQRGLDLLVV